VTERETEGRGRETTGIERVSRLSGRGGGQKELSKNCKYCPSRKCKYLQIVSM
jgi:hypothetical protein